MFAPLECPAACLSPSLSRLLDIYSRRQSASSLLLHYDRARISFGDSGLGISPLILWRFPDFSVCRARIDVHKFDNRFGGSISYALLDFGLLQ
jgi:hypothetical protein